MHRLTVYALGLLAVLLVLSTIVPHFSVIAIVLISILFALSDSKPTQPTHFDHHHHVEIENVPPEYYESYRIYLQSSEWKALRLVVLDRDKYTCQHCGSTSNLHVHHTHYDGIETMSFNPIQLLTLCNTCHTKVHS